ncbi:hypothetical protein FKP32DRAFT_29669 [Trametes sanguinea]|nr:hypothetical protein FKP32DRAFT_29669 [Trametes sanguinea]
MSQVRSYWFWRESPRGICPDPPTRPPRVRITFYKVMVQGTVISASYRSASTILQLKVALDRAQLVHPDVSPTGNMPFAALGKVGSGALLWIREHGRGSSTAGRTAGAALCIALRPHVEHIAVPISFKLSPPTVCLSCG